MPPSPAPLGPAGSDSVRGPVSGIPVELGRTQSLLWTGQRLRPGVPLYNMVLAFEIEGALDGELMAGAHRALVASSDALRTRVTGRDEAAARVAPSALDAPFDEVDLSGAPDPAAAAERWCREEAARFLGGGLDGQWLVRGALLRLGPSRSVYFLAQHHLVSDAWSTSLCFSRLSRFYAALERGESPALEGWPAYEDFVAHERSVASSASSSRAARFWESRPPVAAPASFYGRTLPVRPSARTERVSVALGAELSSRLREQAADARVRGLTDEISCFQLFAGALAALRVRVGGEVEPPERVSMLAPVHNRTKRSFKETVGVFIEVLPLDVDVPADATFAEVLASARIGARDLFVHALPGTSAHVDARGRGIVLNYISSGFEETFAGRPSQARWVHPGHGDADHALRLQVHDFGGTGGFQLDLDMHCDVFGPRERELAPRHLRRLLEAMAEDLDGRVEEAPLLDEVEVDELVLGFQAGAEVPADPAASSAIEAFRAAAAAHPARLAVEVAGGEALTYGELTARVDGLAAALEARGIGEGGLVAVALERSVNFAVSVLAVLSRGAAYAPMDPASPRERLAAMLDACAPDLVLAAGELLDRQGTLDPTSVAAATASASAPDIRPEQLAYVLHTSGSTGRPKGTEVTHGSLWNYLRAARAAYGFDGDEPRCAALFTSVAVDMTVTSLMLPLVSGGVLRIHPRGDGEVDLAVLDVIAEGRVHLVKLTPSHLSLLLQQRSLEPGALDTLVVGGEDFPVPVARAAQDALGAGVAILNEYGPTEATVACMLHRYDPERDTGASVPIGRPFAGGRIHLVDRGDRAVPPGCAGEILIGGPGVARGYRGLADETAARFTADPFAARLGDPEARVYRTGDVARRDPITGDLVFLGRRDEQVKVRGHRVELGEVRAALTELPGVGAAEVVTRRVERPAPAAASELLDLADDPRWADVRHCVRCGLASNHPEARLDEAGVCAVCREFDAYRDAAEAYFGTPADMLAELPRRPEAEHDCIALLSGGKDSTYALYQLVRMGLRPLVFSLDNGFISEGAKANIRRVVEDLGLELVFATTPSMNAIFADSLDRFSNVCQGCFKTIWTLSTQLAKERGITRIVTGLSRGQIFETRLAPIFRMGLREPAEVDAAVIDARRAYHRVDDAVSRHLDVGLFAEDEIFEEVRYVDFYRYHDVPLEEVLRFIGEEAAWRRPEDTGRSTNCLINDVGIAVHKKTRGYHNYALPYSWDVRLGHKTRDECLDELDDEIDGARVDEILREVGAAESTRKRGEDALELVAYVAGGRDLEEGSLREGLVNRLTPAMIPARIVVLDELPLAASGKVDRARLPDPDGRAAAAFEEPVGDDEMALAGIWREVLSLDRVGRHDHFLHVGGDSILGLQVVTRARSVGLGLEPRDVFDAPTIAELARIAKRLGAVTDHAAVEPVGTLGLTPIQRWFFDADPLEPGHFAMSFVFELERVVTAAELRAALAVVIERHPVLRTRFGRGEDGWQAEIPVSAAEPTTLECAAGELEATIERGAAGLDLERGSLVAAALAPTEAGTRLGLVIHHLAVDAVSWGTVAADLGPALAGDDGHADAPVGDSWRAWALAGPDPSGYAVPESAGSHGREGEAWTVARSLDAETTARLEDRAREAGAASMEERAMAALALALAAGPSDLALSSRGGALTIDVEGIGRHRANSALDVSRSVGWFTELRAVDVDTRDEGAALASAGRAATRSPGAGAVLFNDLGSIGSESTVGGMGVARGLLRHRAGDAQRTHALEVHLTRDGGSLTVHLRAVDAVLSKAAAEAIVDDVTARLRTQAGAGHSAADFAGSGLGQEDLDDLLGDLGDL